MTREHTGFLTLAVLWTALALAFLIPVNRIGDRPVQVGVMLLYVVVVVAITRVINGARRA